MAIITTDARNNLIAIYICMFKTAPGTTAVSEMVAAVESGKTNLQIATDLSAKAGFSAAYPGYQTGQEFADSLVAWLLGGQTPAGARDWATNWVLNTLQSGKTRAEVIVNAVEAVRATANVNYEDAKAQLENRVSVATYLAVTKHSDISTSVLQNVTSDLHSVTQAQSEIDNLTTPAMTTAQEQVGVVLHKMFYDAAPNHAQLAELKATHTEGTAAGQNGLDAIGIELLRKSFNESLGLTQNINAIADLIVTNLHIAEIAPALVLGATALIKESLTAGAAEGETSLGHFVAELAQGLLGKSIAVDATLRADLDRLADYVIASARVAHAFAGNPQNTTTNLTTLKTKDEPLTHSGNIGYTDTGNDDTFSVVSGQLTAGAGFSLDNSALRYGIDGVDATGAQISKTTAYGTLSLNTQTGAYNFIPSDAAIEGLKTTVGETIKLTLSDSGSTPSTAWTNLSLNFVGADDTGQGSLAVTQSIPFYVKTRFSGSFDKADRDTADSVFVVQENVAGTYGNFSVSAEGRWVYEQFAYGIQGMEDRFTVALVGGATGTATFRYDDGNSSSGNVGGYVPPI